MRPVLDAILRRLIVIEPDGVQWLRAAFDAA